MRTCNGYKYITPRIWSVSCENRLWQFSRCGNTSADFRMDQTLDIDSVPSQDSESFDITFNPFHIQRQTTGMLTADWSPFVPKTHLKFISIRKKKEYNNTSVRTFQRRKKNEIKNSKCVNQSNSNSEDIWRYCTVLCYNMCFLLYFDMVWRQLFFFRETWMMMNWLYYVTQKKREIYTLMLVLVSSRIEQWNPKRIQEFSYEENKSFTFFRGKEAKKTKERGLTCHLIVRTSRKSRQSSFTRNHYEKLPCTSFRQFPNKNKSRVNHFNINDCHCNFLC